MAVADRKHPTVQHVAINNETGMTIKIFFARQNTLQGVRWDEKVTKKSN
jgi:hypothetical protein